MVNRLMMRQNPILKRDLQENSFPIKVEIKNQTHLIIYYFSNGLEKVFFIDRLWKLKIPISQLFSQLSASLQPLISSVCLNTIIMDQLGAGNNVLWYISTAASTWSHMPKAMKHMGFSVSSRWMPSWSKQELHSVHWHRPLFWLGLVCRASFFLPGKSTLSPTKLMPCSCNGGTCMSS